MAKISFLKMHGIGNDFIVIPDFESRVPAISPEQARLWCDRRFGVGADQILWLRPAQGTAADARMEIINADGSIAEMCGNGIRAAGIYLFDHGPRSAQPKYRIETLAGILSVEVRDRSVTVNMGAPVLGGGFSGSGEELDLGVEKVRFFEVSMGNPHAVIFVDDVSRVALEKLGPLIENHPRFPKRTNVEFVQTQSATEIEVRVWERGTGVTLACGTGACASAVAALATSRVSGKVRVTLPGGALNISWKGGTEPVMMEGPAVEVFRGEIEI